MWNYEVCKMHMEFSRERRLAIKISEEILMPNVDKWKSISCAGKATGFQRDSRVSPNCLKYHFPVKEV